MVNVQGTAEDPPPSSPQPFPGHCPWSPEKGTQRASVRPKGSFPSDAFGQGFTPTRERPPFGQACRGVGEVWELRMRPPAVNTGTAGALDLGGCAQGHTVSQLLCPEGAPPSWAEPGSWGFLGPPLLPRPHALARLVMISEPGQPRGANCPRNTFNEWPRELALVTTSANESRGLTSCRGGVGDEGGRLRGLRGSPPLLR